MSGHSGLEDATRAAEFAARASYGKILALLSRQAGDISLAEDCLSEAFAKALANWPIQGIPKNPDAWLMTVAKNKITDHQRKYNRIKYTDEIPEPDIVAEDNHDLPDERLALMLVCTHPSIRQDLHTPLMLQTVLGVEAKIIAQLFLVSPAALTKRLVRAKAKIKDAGVPFRIPGPELLGERSNALYEAIYAVHALDWLDPGDGLGDEALYLANLLTQMLSGQPEALGLASLIAFGHSRRQARLKQGVFIPLEQQDTDLWDKDLISYAEARLRKASQWGQPGRFQLEAAIQSVHMRRRFNEAIDWPALNKLYYALLNQWPSAGGLVAHALVTAKIHGSEAGLNALEQVEAETGTGFQPLWAARAELFSNAGHVQNAIDAYDKAISLTTEPPLRLFLEEKKQTLL